MTTEERNLFRVIPDSLTSLFDIITNLCLSDLIVAIGDCYTRLFFNEKAYLDENEPPVDFISLKTPLLINNNNRNKISKEKELFNDSDEKALQNKYLRLHQVHYL